MTLKNSIVSNVFPLGWVLTAGQLFILLFYSSTAGTHNCRIAFPCPNLPSLLAYCTKISQWLGFCKEMPQERGTWCWVVVMRYPKLWLIQYHFDEGNLLSRAWTGKNAERPEFCYLLCNHLKLKTWRRLTFFPIICRFFNIKFFSWKRILSW